MELAKIFLHLSDVYALPGFTNTRHSSLVALAVTRPRLVAPYLTREFYAPHYNLRQRMDVLEVSCERRFQTLLSVYSINAYGVCTNGMNFVIDFLSLPYRL